MSGPLKVPDNTIDGITWTVRQDLGAPMVYPATAHSNQLTPPDYWLGPLPYYGDFQLTPSGIAPMRLVIEFDTPIKQIRSTAQFVGVSGMAMYAVVEEADFVGGLFTAAKFVTWNANVSGTRTLTHEPGFRFVVLQSVITSPSMGSTSAGPTFRNTFFFEELPTIEPVVAPEPDLRIPRGAGRLISFAYPMISWPGFTNPQQMNMRPQSQATTLGNIVQSVIGVPPPGVAQVKYRGIPCLRLPAGNNTGYVHAPLAGDGRPFQAYIGTERMLKADLDEQDEIACWRLIALLAFEQPLGPIACDAGIVWGPGANTQIRGGAAQAGMFFGMRGIDDIGLSVRTVDGGALTDRPAIDLPDGFDLEDWHTYEMRLVSATTAAEAVLRCLLDEEVVYEEPWGPGTILPPPKNGAAYGYYWSVNNRGGSPDFTTRMYLAPDGVGFHGAMTEDALL